MGISYHLPSCWSGLRNQWALLVIWMCAGLSVGAGSLPKRLLGWVQICTGCANWPAVQWALKGLGLHSGCLLVRLGWIWALWVSHL